MVIKYIYLWIIVFLVLSPITFHPDIKIIYNSSSYMSKFGVFNIYEYLNNNIEKAVHGPFVYPPGMYFLFGSVYPLSNIVAGQEFNEWLSTGNTLDMSKGYVPRYIFLMKLPIAMFHIVGGILVYKLTKRLSSFLLWMFSPVSIYTTIIMGQADIIIATTIVASIFFFERKRVLASSLFLGIASAIKTFPILFLPSLIIRSKEKFIVLITFFITYLVFIVPFLRSDSFWKDTYTSNLSLRILEPKILNIPYMPVMFAVLYLFIYISPKDYIKLTGFGFAAMLSTINAHPQWIVWSLPFFSLIINRSNRVFIYAWTLTFIVSALTSNDRFIGLSLLSPIDQNIVNVPALITQLSSQHQLLLASIISFLKIGLLAPIFFKSK